MSTDTEENDKQGAYEFLRGLESALRKLPPAPEMNLSIRTTVAASKPHHDKRHLRGPESAFLNQHVIPELSAAIRKHARLSEEQARIALLNEYCPSMPAYSKTTPARTVRHPFTKVLGHSAIDVYKRWSDPDSKSALVQSCPDFALRPPFPHKIVFEGKYFSGGSADYARRTLATDLYQAFFYRRLPRVPETKRGRAAWDYDYACLLAYDASRDGTLKAAWEH